MRNNLLSMLQRPAVNKVPFTFSTSAAAGASTGSISSQSFVINDLNSNKGLSVLNKIREGNVGSTNQSINIVANSSSREEIPFDVYEMFKTIKSYGGIKTTQAHMTYDSKATINNKKLHEYNSRRISEIQVNGVYEGILNSTDVVALSQKLTAKSINSWMESSKVTIRVPGRNFLGTAGRDPIKLGDNIDIRVLSAKNTFNQTETEVDYDKGQSGEYIIQSIRHMFSFQKYHVIAECTKLTDEQNANEKI